MDSESHISTIRFSFSMLAKWSMLVGIKHCYKAWGLLHDSNGILSIRYGKCPFRHKFMGHFFLNLYHDA